MELQHSLTVLHAIKVSRVNLDISVKAVCHWDESWIQCVRAGSPPLFPPAVLRASSCLTAPTRRLGGLNCCDTVDHVCILWANSH